MNKSNINLAVLSVFIVTAVTIASFDFQTDKDKIKRYKGGNDKSSNGTKTAYTQSVPDQDFMSGTCSGCHGGGSITPTVNVTFSPALIGDTAYELGTVYTISYATTGYPFFGLDVEMNKNNTSTSMTSGTLAAQTRTRYTANPYNQGLPSNITHNAKIPQGSSAIFTWTAPTTPDTVYFFSNTVGVNGNSNDNGDRETFYNRILYPKLSFAGLNEKDRMNVKVFPNPAKHHVVIQLPIKNQQVYITLVDLSGKTVFRQLEKMNGNMISLNVDEFSKGIYYLNVESNGVVYKERLVIE